MWNSTQAAPWSTHYNDRDRRSHQKRTEQRCQEEWTWEDNLDGEGPWTQAGEHHHPREQMEAAREERQRYEELSQRRKKCCFSSMFRVIFLLEDEPRPSLKSLED
jgi:hypothetical protein